MKAGAQLAGAAVKVAAVALGVTAPERATWEAEVAWGWAGWAMVEVEDGALVRAAGLEAVGLEAAVRALGDLAVVLEVEQRAKAAGQKAMGTVVDTEVSREAREAGELVDALAVGAAVGAVTVLVVSAREAVESGVVPLETAAVDRAMDRSATREAAQPPRRPPACLRGSHWTAVTALPTLAVPP